MKKIPIGIENFKEMIDKKYYYVDKTQFISGVINEKVISYTRPRRFGKTLNMSMLYYFFSNKEKDNAYLFNGLKITKDYNAMKHQNQYPTIFITLKDMKSMNFSEQKQQFASLISNIINEYSELFESDILNECEIDRLIKYRDDTSTLVELENSLKMILDCLYKYYHQEVIILIDEYDVPLQSAYANNYYDVMVNF
ncbi:AAA family ATPase [Candidatus Stoquefichus massiliensis]|uniref:AAA family ATPase n=1 Tax=Candidatus Stoquefichus massiliensis TaxID=1470350 RepID=UPI0004AC7551|nr:AAA family ATPase [Candidatus Stoquefichus massiliensis]